jgi:hypothetical protein
MSLAVLSRTRFLCPSGRRAMPYRISASVTTVVHSSLPSRLRIQLATCGAGSGRINSETTVVSRTILH